MAGYVGDRLRAEQNWSLWSLRRTDLPTTSHLLLEPPSLLLLLLATLRKPPSVIIAMCGAGKAIKTWIHLSKDMAKEVAMGEDSGVYTVTRPPPVYFATAWQGRLHHSLAKPDSAKTEPADYKLDRGCTWSVVTSVRHSEFLQLLSDRCWGYFWQRSWPLSSTYPGQPVGWSK